MAIVICRPANNTCSKQTFKAVNFESFCFEQACMQYGALLLACYIALRDPWMPDLYSTSTRPSKVRPVWVLLDSLASNLFWLEGIPELTQFFKAVSRILLVSTRHPRGLQKFSSPGLQSPASRNKALLGSSPRPPLHDKKACFSTLQISSAK